MPKWDGGKEAIEGTGGGLSRGNCDAATIIRAVFMASGISPQQDSRLKFPIVPIMPPQSRNRRH